MEKIKDIGRELVSHEFMSTSVSEEIEAIVQRWSGLRRRANQRAEILEREANEAKQSEKCISQFETWLTRVDDILTEHLENDVTIEDLPDDFQVKLEEIRKTTERERENSLTNFHFISFHIYLFI